MNLRPAVLIALAFLANFGWAADDSKPTSDQTEKRILDRLPNYDKEASEAARKAAETPPPEEGVVVLPEMTVIERQKQKMKEEDLYRKGLRDEQLVRKELSDFDRSVLNRYRLPLLGISNGARARAIYLERKNREFRDDMKHIANVLAVTDPKEAKRLRTLLYDTQ